MVFNIKNTDRNIIEPDDLPFKIIKLANIPIPVDNGTLYAHLWIPQQAYEGKLKVGSIIEYLPYRKNDFTAIRDLIRHPYYAGNGFACLRVDIRGSGDSDGSLKGEYLPQEQSDNLKIIDWIIDQDWSNGNVGQIGKSWGGFNGLQVAYEQHPNLKSIITVCSTDDRYADDVHYRGGCMMASDMNWWASTMFVYNARPQDPKIRPNWKSNWQERLELDPPVVDWVKHQRRDDFWKHGSVCEDYSRVDIPVLAIGGWRDGYTNAVFRMMDGLENPNNKCIIGPWVHEFPDVATPGPTIGYDQLVVSWFHKYLSNDMTQTFDIDSLKKYNMYIQDAVDDGGYDFRPGKWVGFDKLNNECDDKFKISMAACLNTSLGSNITTNTDNLNNYEFSFSGLQEYGMYRGKWCAFGEPGDFPPNQIIDDSKSFNIDFKPLEQDIECIGIPEVNLEISSDLELANLSIRLLDVSNVSSLVSWGQINLNKVIGTMENPKKLEVGKYYKIKVKLDAIGYKFCKGSKIRLALSTTDWPSFWPLEKTPTLTVKSSSVDISLPLVPPQSTSISFLTSESLSPLPREIIRPESRTREVIHDVVNELWKINDFSDEGEREIDGLIMGSKNWNSWQIGHDPLSAITESNWELTLKRDTWDIKFTTFSTMSVEPGYFILDNKLVAFEGNQQIFEKKWHDKIERDFP